MKFCYSLCLLLTSNLVYGQVWTNFYEHNSPIQHFSVNAWNDHLAIHDGNRLIIETPDGKKEYTSLTYNLPTVGDFSADLTDILFLRHANKQLYVATRDSNLLLFDGLDFVGGLPRTYIYDCHIDEDEQFVATFDFVGNRYFGDIDVENLTLDPYGNFQGKDFFGYDVRDISLEDIYSTLEPSTNTIIHLTQSNATLNVNPFNMNLLPFNEFKEIEAVNQVICLDDNGFRVRKFTMWALTDNGLALYISDRGAFDFRDWTEQNWMHFSKDNSWLRTNTLTHLQRINITSSSTSFRHFFVSATNDPKPNLYYFDAKGESACIFTPNNSLLSSLPITNVEQDGRRGIFVSQGRQIRRLEIEEDMACMVTSTTEEKEKVSIKAYPNPVFDQLVVETSSLNAKQGSLQIIDVHGRICKEIAYLPSRHQIKINVHDLPQGMYLLQSNLGHTLRFTKR